MQPLEWLILYHYNVSLSIERRMIMRIKGNFKENFYEKATNSGYSRNNCPARV
jgi:hypothetical protein